MYCMATDQRSTAQGGRQSGLTVRDISNLVKPDSFRLLVTHSPHHTLAHTCRLLLVHPLPCPYACSCPWPPAPHAHAPNLAIPTPH